MTLKCKSIKISMLMVHLFIVKMISNQSFGTDIFLSKGKIFTLNKKN